MYQQVINDLRIAYDGKASERDQEAKTPWKLAERQHFLELLRQEGKQTLLEIGAGTGHDSRFFADNGLHVTCTDLSPEMVRFCREKGLDAHVMDFLHLAFPAQSFDAVYSLNCLLHVPSQDLPVVLAKIRDLLKPGGLFFLGIYGGLKQEGIATKDHHEPKRFFSYHTDEELQAIASQYFEIVSFQAIPLQLTRHEGPAFHFQCLILKTRHQ